jgi:hypothetical protein
MGDGSPPGITAKGKVVSVSRTGIVSYQLADLEDAQYFKEIVGLDSVVHVLPRPADQGASPPKK